MPDDHNDLTPANLHRAAVVVALRQARTALHNVEAALVGGVRRDAAAFYLAELEASAATLRQLAAQAAASGDTPGQKKVIDPRDNPGVCRK